MENGLILCKLALKNFGNQDIHFSWLSSGKLNVKSIGRPKKKTPEVVEEVRGLMEAILSKSIRKLSQQIHLSYGTSHTILKKDLHMFPYKVQVYHKILPRDFVPK
ncbi:hypothetical protein BDFB_004354, partial [Asbolus verrucosus]